MSTTVFTPKLRQVSVVGLTDKTGVLQLSLEGGSYSWRFIDVEGRVQDAGEARCRTTVN